MTNPPAADPLEIALRYPDAPTTDTAPTAGAGAVPSAVGDAVTVSAEQLLVGTEWFVSGRVRLRRRVVTEYRTIEVAVRREIVELEGETVDFRDGHLVGTAWDGPAVAAPSEPLPFVAVLREEVPVVTLQVRPYERMTATTSLVRGAATVRDTVRHEDIEITTHPTHDTKEH